MRLGVVGTLALLLTTARVTGFFQPLSRFQAKQQIRTANFEKKHISRLLSPRGGDRSLPVFPIRALSLDQSLLPRRSFISRLSPMSIIILLSFWLLTLLLKEPNGATSKLKSVRDDLQRVVDNRFIAPIKSIIGTTGKLVAFGDKKTIADAVSVLSVVPKFFVGAWNNIKSGIYSKASAVLGLPKFERFDLAEWNMCVLEEKVKLGEFLTKYRFRIPHNNQAVVSTDVGQEISLCAIDARGQTLKGNFFPVSPLTAKGYFEIVCRSGGYVLNEKIPLALQFMAVGDELGVKAGKRRLVYNGADPEILNISLICSGVGIAPALQIVRKILQDRESTVEGMDLLWINESEEDFILTDDVTDLETKHVERLFVTRVLDEDADNPDTLINDQLNDAIMPYQPGSIAVVMAPDALADKSILLLENLGYPAENILLMPSS